ncbi:transmembrane 4 L6 family member 18-like [Rhinophrynus dorsalis]
MFPRDCSDCSSLALIPLAIWSIVVNILLYFPNGETMYAGNNQLTNYVWYFEGICFGGIMMLIIATVLLLVRNYNCCTSCLEMKQCDAKYSRLGQPVFAFLGVVFSGYSLIISSLGLAQGPYCRTALNTWEYPFKNTAGGYLAASSSWSQCLEPTYVVEWNIILFSILIVLSALQVILCFSKAIYELKTIICGTHSILSQGLVCGRNYRNRRRRSLPWRRVKVSWIGLYPGILLLCPRFSRRKYSYMEKLGRSLLNEGWLWGLMTRICWWHGRSADQPFPKQT